MQLAHNSISTGPIYSQSFLTNLPVGIQEFFDDWLIIFLAFSYLLALKTVVAIVLLFVFAIQFAGTHCYFIFRLIEIRNDAYTRLRSLPRQKLTRMRLSQRQYKQAKAGNDEIKIGNNMYDVAFVEERKDSVIVYAMHDQDEGTFLTLVHTIVKRIHHDRKRIPHAYMKIFGLSYLASFFQVDYPKVAKQLPNTNYFKLYSSVDPSLNTPPPKGILQLSA
jgi:hypothetical protein